MYYNFGGAIVKRVQFHTRKILILGIAVLFILVFALSITPSLISVINLNNTNTKPVFIIDPGHGLPDGGCTGVSGTVEYNLNLQVAKKLKALFDLFGYETIMTRYDEYSIFDKNNKAIRSKKLSDINNRLKIFNQYQDVLIISIHMNAFPDKSCSGSQIFYSNSDLAQSMADRIRTELKKLQPDNNRVCKVIPKTVFLFKKTKNPVILAECGFLSNYNDEKLLNTPEYQEKLAYLMFLGCIS